MATVGEFDGPGALAGAPALVLVDKKDRIWVTAYALPQIFDRQGKFLQAIGVKGSGPGEFAYGGAPMLIPGDSMLLFDPGNARAMIFDPNLRFVRSIRMEHSFRDATVVDWPSSVILSGTVRTRDRFGYPLHRLSFASNEAVLGMSSGPMRQQIRPNDVLPPHKLTTARNGRFWSADFTAYRLRQWNGELQQQALIERSPDWFPTPTADWTGNRQTPPGPSVGAIETDDEGLLWVFVHVPGRQWRQAWPPPSAGSMPRGDQMRYDKLYRTIVEVIDPSLGRVIVRAEVDKHLTTALPKRRAAAYVPTADGVPRVEILEFTINGRHGDRARSFH